MENPKKKEFVKRNEPAPAPVVEENPLSLFTTVQPTDKADMLKKYLESKNNLNKTK